MPITYTVDHEGHFIHAVAIYPVTIEEFIEYEVAHATDERVKPPVSELLETQRSALKEITLDDMRKALKRREKLEREPEPHRCAIVVSPSDAYGWNLAKFYEGMVMLHTPETVIVFGDVRLARIWLGVKE
ncbi:MAG TPA: hypothetical protein VMW42_05060 [Desulfatiglandales bacterium]|nr:hypothetical protein [Desulfatiglandales bacterium]